MRNAIIWGTGQGYEEIINQIMFEIAKGNLRVSAVVSPSRTQMSTGGRLDSFPLISKAEITQYPFEFIIVTSGKYFREIQQEAVAMGISEDKVINGTVFKLPMFDFKRYLKLFENPVTILSDDCWGGHIYHRLCMKFCSPLINIWWPKDSYARFIQDPAYYFSQPLQMEREGNMREGIVPVGSLGNGSKEEEFIKRKKKGEVLNDEINKRKETDEYIKQFLSIYRTKSNEYYDPILVKYSDLVEEAIKKFQGEYISG